MLNSDEKYLILMNNAMVVSMEAHASDEISDENKIHQEFHLRHELPSK